MNFLSKAFGGGKSTEEADPDSGRLISGWTGSLTPPKWIDKDSYQDCHHCREPFASGHQHNVRVCLINIHSFPLWFLPHV
jgi:hypothetical protein